MANRRKHTSSLKARAAREAMKGQKSVCEIACEFGVHPNLITRWKKEAVEKRRCAFSRRKEKGGKEKQELKSEFSRKIRQLEDGLRRA